MSRSLTAVDVEEAAALYRDGHGIRAIAARFGCSTRQVNVKLRDAGVQMRPAHGAPTVGLDVAEAQVLYAAGANLRDLAAGFGCSKGTVARALREVGVALRPTGRRAGGA